MYWVQIVDGIVLRRGVSSLNMPSDADDGVDVFESEADALEALPVFKAHIAKSHKQKASVTIDAKSGVSKIRSHLAKAFEAERVLFDGVRDLERLPYLRAELVNQPDARLSDLARLVWAKHCHATPTNEATRTKQKRDLNV